MMLLTRLLPFLIAMAVLGLPAPTGPFPVGRLTMLWSDPGRLEDGNPREVLAYVYYPATATGDRAEYFPGLRGIENANEARFLRQQFGDLWSAVVDGSIRTNAFDAPPMLSGKKKFPVLVFSPGALAPVLGYQLQLQELASRGYVVLGLEHGTDSALIIRPNHTLLAYVDRGHTDKGPPTVAGLEANRDETIRRTADIVFAVNQISLLSKGKGGVFYERLDLSRLGAFGHSAGGKAAIRSCQVDARVHACLNQDGEMFGIPFGSTEPVPSLLPDHKITVPIAVLYVAEPGIPDAQLAAVHVTRIQYEEWRSAKNRALRAFLQDETKDSTLITISAPGFVHASFMDMGLLGGNTTAISVANHKKATELTRMFFDAELSLGGKYADGLPVAEEGINAERISGKRKR